MSTMFLTEDEVAELSGYVSTRHQIQWLRENGWAFERDKDGKPKLLRAAVVARLGGGAQNDGFRPKLRL